MSANTGVYGDSPDMTEGTSVDPHPIREREPLPGALQAKVDSNACDEEVLYQWFKDIQNSFPNIHVAPGNYKLSLQSVEEVEKLWEQSISKQPLMEKMFKSLLDDPSVTSASTTIAVMPKSKSLQRGMSFCLDSRKLVETSDKWYAFLKQLNERRRKIYKIVNTLHDHRLSEQKAILDDIEEVLGKIYIDSKDLKQLQLEQSLIKDYPDRLKECQTVLEKVLSMPKPILVNVNAEFFGIEDDEQILEHCLALFQKANQMLERCKNLSLQLNNLCSNLKCKINHEIDEILFQIDELSFWLEDTYKLFLLKPSNLSHADKYLLVDWNKIFTFIKITCNEDSFLDSMLLPGESSVDFNTSCVTNWEQESKHTAECILDMIKDVLSVHKLEAQAHKLELCLARGNLIAMKTDILAQLNRIQFLWQHLKEYGDLRIAELNFAITLQGTFELISEGQDELMNFEEKFIDLDHEILENEFVDFQAFFYEIEFFPSLEKLKDEMHMYLEGYVSLCTPNLILKVSEDSLKMEIENLNQKYEDMVMKVNSQKMFYENGLEILKDLHEVIDKFKEWLSTTEEVVYCDLYGNSYLELCAYYEAVKSLLGDLIQQEQNFEAIMCRANTILDQCSDDVEKQLNSIVDDLNTRWVTVSDIIVSLGINIYGIIQLWAAYECRYAEVQAFIDDLSNSIQKEPLESSDGDLCLLPKYKAVNAEIVKYQPQYKELMDEIGQKLANHDKLGTKENIQKDLDKLKVQWDHLCDVVAASIESLQQELSDWFLATFAHLEVYLHKGKQLLQQMNFFVSVDATYDDTLSDQMQFANKLISDYNAVFSEENSQNFYQLLQKIFDRRMPHDLDTTDTSVLGFEPLSHEDITKAEALQSIWNENLELANLYLILLKLRVKVLEYMGIIHDGQAFCAIQFHVDLESIKKALNDYEKKFDEDYFKSLQSLLEQMHLLAGEFTKNCPDGEDRITQGDSQEIVYVALQESYDSLVSTVNKKCKALQQSIKLWHNYTDLKEAVSTIIDDVQQTVDKLKRLSHDPTIPPTSIAEHANQLKLELESNIDRKQAFISAKEELEKLLHEDPVIDDQMTEEVMHISTRWHNLFVTLNQFVSQAVQRSEEFVAFVIDLNKLATEITNLRRSIEKEIDIDLPQRDNQDYARKMIERRDILEALQSKCNEYQSKRDSKRVSGISWQSTIVPKNLLVEFPSELCAGDNEDSDWIIHNHFDILAKQMEALQVQLDKREDKLEKNEETVLIFKGLSEELLNWLEQQLALPIMNRLPDADQEQLKDDISILQSLKNEIGVKIKKDKMELDEQRAKLKKRNLREDTHQEIQQIANCVDEAMASLEYNVADQLAKFEEAERKLVSFLDKIHGFDEWLNKREAELEACWPLGANLPLLLDKGVYINKQVKDALDSTIALPNDLLDTEECIRPLFNPDSLSSVSILPQQLKVHYSEIVDDCEEKIEYIQDATNELQQFMVMYDKFMEWVNAMLVNITTRSQTKHSVGITESKLEEHKEFVAETIEVKVEEFEDLKENSNSLTEKYPPSDWLTAKMKESYDQWNKLLKCCDEHKKHLEWLLERWVAYERTVSELLDWVMTEAEKFAKDVTTRGDKGVVDHIKSCEELHRNLEDKNSVMGDVIKMSEDLAKHDARKENGTDDISSRRNDVVQHWDSLINLLAETLLRLESTHAELKHVLQVLEEESDLIDGLEIKGTLPPTCYGNTDTLFQQLEHFEGVLVETKSHDDKIAYLDGYLDFVEEHSCKVDRDPRQQMIKKIVVQHALLIEQSSKVLTVGRQALPLWQEYNNITMELSDWMMDCNQKLCSSQYQSGNAFTTKQSLENSKMLLIEIVSQQAVVDNMTRQSNVLTTYCLTEDDREFLAHSTAQHVHNYQELLEACRERVLLLEQRKLTWQSFPVAEAAVVQELVGNIDEAVHIDFTVDTMADDMFSYLEQLEELETQQEESENAVMVIDTAFNKEEVQKASEENPDINEEKDRLLAEFAASKARLKEKLARVKAQVKAVTQLEDAINRLEACVDDHQSIITSDLPVGPILEIDHEKLKEDGVCSQTELSSALQNFDMVLVLFNQQEREYQIGIPPDLNRRVEKLKEICPELLKVGDCWPTKIKDSLTTWIELKESIGKINAWISTAESEFSSIQNIPKFLMDFNALEDRFQMHADNLQDQKETYTDFITAIKPHLDSMEETVVPFRKKVDKLLQRWDTLNKELGELEQAMVPWRQLLDCRDGLEHFLTPLEELYEVEAANANQLPLGSNFFPFIVKFKDSIQKMNGSENLLLELQQKVKVNLTEEVYKKHASARKLHQLFEQLVNRWNELKEKLNDMLESVQLKADEWMKNARESIDCQQFNEYELAKIKKELQAQTEYREQLEKRLATMPPNPVLADDCGPCWKVLIILLLFFAASILLFALLYYYWSSHENHCQGDAPL